MGDSRSGGDERDRRVIEQAGGFQCIYIFQQISYHFAIRQRQSIIIHTHHHIILSSSVQELEDYLQESTNSAWNSAHRRIPCRVCFVAAVRHGMFNFFVPRADKRNFFFSCRRFDSSTFPTLCEAISRTQNSYFFGYMKVQQNIHTNMNTKIVTCLNEMGKATCDKHTQWIDISIVLYRL